MLYWPGRREALATPSFMETLLMDPIALATVTSAITVLVTEFARGAVSEAGKDTWAKIKSLFGWKRDPEPGVLAPAVAQRLHNDPELVRQVLAVLREHAPETASALVGSIDAEKVVVATKIDVVNM